MTSSTEEYTRDVEFNSGYIFDQDPGVAAFIAARRGQAASVARGGYTYVDLGCGNGRTLTLLAAANPDCSFIGVDFNPDHLARARQIAEEAGLANLELREGDLLDPAVLDALPECDVITIQGTFSWLPEDGAHRLLERAGRRLRPGGMFLVQRMCLPAKAAIVPVWYLMRLLTPGRNLPDDRRAGLGVNQMQRVLDAGAAFFEENPQAQKAFTGHASQIGQNPNKLKHLAHHAMAEHWRPYYFAELAGMAEEAGLTYAGTMNRVLNEPELALSPDQRVVWESFTDDPSVAETLLDFLRNDHNRTEIFVRPGLGDADQARRFAAEEVALFATREARFIPRNIRRPDDSRIDLSGEACDRLIEAWDQAPRTLAELAGDGEVSEEDWAAAGHLFATGAYQLVWREGDTDPAARFNRIELGRAVEEPRPAVLASPWTGAGIQPLSIPETVFLHASLQEGLGSLADLVEYARKRFAETTVQVPLPGGRMALKDLSRAQIEELAQRFIDDRVPRLQVLGIVG